METFYIVLNKYNPVAKNKRHLNEEDARKEASEACDKTGEPFIVMKAMAYCQREVIWMPFEVPQVRTNISQAEFDSLMDAAPPLSFPYRTKP